MSRTYAESPSGDQPVTPLYFDAPGALIDEFVRDYADGPVKTQRFYADQVGRAFRQFLDGAGVRRVNEITPQLVRDFLEAERARGLSRKSVQHRYMSAWKFLSWCVQNGYLTTVLGLDKRMSPTMNPASLVKKPTVPRVIRVGFTRDELRAIVREASPSARNKRNWIGVRNRAMIYFLLGTGARADEMLAMNLDDVRWADGTNGPRVYLQHGKGERARPMPVGRNMATALRDYLRVRPRVNSEALWVGLFGDRLTYDGLKSMCRRVEVYSGVDDVEPHRFRHTFAVAHYEANRDLIGCQHALGHSSPETTMRYLQGLGVSFHLRAKHPSPDEWLLG